MEVTTSTLGKSLEIVEPVTPQETVTDTVIPVLNETNAPDDIVIPQTVAELQKQEPPKGDEVVAFDFPESTEDILENPVNTPPVISWKDAVKGVPEDEIAELLGDDDFIKGMRKHIKNGGKPIDYITAKGVNWDNVTDEDLVKSELRKDFPDATNTQIERLFSKKYNQTDFAEDEDKEDGLLLMKSEARKLRNARVSEQKNFQIPEATPIPQQVQQPQIDEARQAKLQKDGEFIANHEATKNLFQSKRVAIEIADGVKQNMSIANPQALYDIWFKPGGLERFTRTQQGEPDVQKLQEAAMFLANPAQFKKQIYNAGKEAGLKSFVDEGQNAGKQAIVLPMQSSDPSLGEAFSRGLKQSTLGKLGAK